MDCLLRIEALISFVCSQRSGRCVPVSRNAQLSVRELPRTCTILCCKALSALRCSRMVVRDDGCGIDPRVLRAGREGHWGLQGMRERAERVGAKLRVWSRTAAGTEVALSVPNSIAFESRMVKKLSGCSE